MTLLNVSDLTATYGVSQALFGVSLQVGEGEVVALMGRNGMGKTFQPAVVFLNDDVVTHGKPEPNMTISR